MLIILIAILLRIYMWPNALTEVNCDEAMTAINAKSIAESGKDIYGTSFPVYFEAWGFAGQSALLTYLMAISIKIFGFSIFSVRLPLLIISIISIFIIYNLCKKIFKDKKVATIILLFLAINPWHIMQSKWSLDCNIFPHLMLISTYMIYLGIKNDKYLYLSMIFYGLTMYSYGISLYIVPIFLIISSIILYRKKIVTLKNIAICICIYLLVSLPIFLMVLVNYFQLDEIKLGNITIQYFESSNRTNDMLIFSENKVETLKNNVISLLKVILLQNDGLEWNAIKNYGVYYYFSIPFLFIGLYNCVKNRKAILILVWFVLSLIIGVLINDININRLNIIWYPIIILCGYGIYEVINQTNDKIVKYIIILLYISVSTLFNNTYYKSYTNVIGNSWCWSAGLVDSVKYAIQIGEQKQIVISKKIYKNKLAYDMKKDTYIKYSINLCNREKNLVEIQKEDINKNIKQDKIYIINEYELDELNIDNLEVRKFGTYLVVNKKDDTKERK